MVKRMTRWLVVRAAFIVVCVLGINSVKAAAADALPYARSYLITGNYVASGVDFTSQVNPPDVHGIATGTIHISGVPKDADIIAAYLYFETITYTASLSDANGVTFRGNPVLLNDVMGVKKGRQDLTGSVSACWSSGTPLTATMFRVDVLRWLPIRTDADGRITGKRLVNDADLLAHGLPLHQVQLPEAAGGGNHVPQSAGASLVIVYRDPSQPLRKIVMYDGIHVQSSLNEVTTQSLRGFYQSSAVKSAQITYLIASGQPNKNERIFFGDGTGPNTQISATDPISIGSAVQRGWSTLTYPVSTLMNPASKAALTGSGETARTIIDHTPGVPNGGFDCLTLEGVIFSTAVADVDNDGLPDGIEDAVGGLNDADGQPLPNLNAMGASSSHKDLFVEFNSMQAAANTSYGSAATPFFTDKIDPAKTIITLTDTLGHKHAPTPEALQALAQTYLAHGITPHFDVGNPALYHALGLISRPDWDWTDDFTSNVADQWLVPAAYARGGEVIKEIACTSGKTHCQFPDFPGTIGWKFGLEVYRDQPVGDNGEEISLKPADPNYFDWAHGQHRRRFDRNRLGLFHYVLYGHARGNPKSDFPCILAGGDLAGYDPGTSSCASGASPNPDFNHPTTASGVADLPGENVLVTLGLWDGFVGKPFTRMSTTLHELGHNLNLWHGGGEAVWGNAHPLSGSPTSTFVEPNCKPNYQSSMSYLFQVLGLFDINGQLHMDYSDRDFNGAPFGSLNETGALDNVAPGTKYQPTWFAPFASPLAITEGAQSATRFCDGTRFGTTKPEPMMARVQSPDNTWAIHWNGDQPAALSPDNVNFDAVFGSTQQMFSSAMKGFDDWGHLKLNQIGGGRIAVKFQSGDFADYGSGDFTDFGSGDFTDYGSGDFTDFGSGDFTDFGSGVFLQGSSGDFVDFGSGDFTDFGSGDFLDYGSGSERQELDYETAKGLSKSNPYGLTACIVGQGADCTPAAPFSPQYHRVQLDYNSPTFGQVAQYIIERQLVDPPNSYPWVPAGTSTTRRFIDPAELKNGAKYTYHVRAQFDDDSLSAWSLPLNPPITAVNDAPQAHADTFTANEDVVLTDNVLTNDTDDDSPHSSLAATLVSGPPANAAETFTLNPDGSFTFTPKADFEGGPVTITYSVNDRAPDGTVLSDSTQSTLTINVISRHTTTTVTPSTSPSTYGDPVTFTAHVAAVASTLGTPQGQVQFSLDGGAPVLAVLNTSGDATFTPPVTALTATTGVGHTITATYCVVAVPAHACAAPSGDGFFYGSTGSVAQVVNKRPAKWITQNSGKVYGNADPVPLTTGASDVAPHDFLAIDHIGATYARAAGENAGDYAITATLTDPDLRLGNYNVTNTGATFTIAPRPVTVTANPQMKLYGNEGDPPLTYALTAGSLVGEDTFGGGLSRNPGEAPGTYAITQGTLSLGSNYLLTYVGASFTIAKLTWVPASTAADCVDVDIEGNAISLGTAGSSGDGNQTQCVHGATALLPSVGTNTKYQVTFEYNLSTWDAYNPLTDTVGTGYWDSFSVSVAKAPYQTLALTDPITTSQLPGLAFIWGGTNWNDGVLECNPTSCGGSVYANATVTVPANLAGANYVNVVLDSTTLPDADNTHPSWGTIRIVNVTLVP